MRILWLKTELLHPIDKGGKIRTYQMLKELSRNHHITYLTLDDGTADLDAVELAQEYAHDVVTVPHKVSPKFSPRFYFEIAGNMVSTLPYFMEKYRSPQMQTEISRCLANSRPDVLVCDFLQASINLPDAVDVPTVLFQHNVEAMIWRRHADVASNRLKRAFMNIQWKRSVRYESETCNKFDSVVAVSKEDAEVFRRDYQVPNVFDIPTGVDTEFFARRKEQISTRPNIVFTGSMDWLPNNDGIGWFIKEILPSIRQQVPEVTLTVVGRDPLPELTEIARRDTSIIITGRVPDVRPYMEDAAVYVVPLRIGGGTRLKIYEAMSMGLPVVSTTIGAEGLPLLDGEELLLCDKTEEFAKTVAELLSAPQSAMSFAKRGSARVRQNFSWKGVADRFGEICESTKNINVSPRFIFE